MKFRRRRKRLILIIVLIASLVAIGLLARPTYHLYWTASHDVDGRPAPPPGHIDDASRLNSTKVAEVQSISPDARDPEGQLAALLQRARVEGRRVSIAGARHSMGGHTIYPGGVVIDMRLWDRMSLDPERNLLHVQAGALWEDVLAYLDAHDRSVKVMQSNHSFSVGGSISVNCHGWPYGQPPIASTVESLRLMRADGTIVNCSRGENTELFALVLGGYGLFGVILDVELRVAANERYRVEQLIAPFDQVFAPSDVKLLAHPDARMVFGRMSVAPGQFLTTAVVNFFYRESGDIPKLTAPGMAELRRTIFRGSAESDYGKELRWSAETRLQPWIAKTSYSRNQLLNEGVEVFQNRTADSTDILHEYFVPPARAADFIRDMQEILPRHDANLLNVTIRVVNEDKDSFLRYADQRMIAFVMLFVQKTTSEGEHRMREVTRELIDAALDRGGRYYLPYRLHADPDQFRRAYPQADEFFRLKRVYDPSELFQNQFYARYALGRKP